VSDEIEGQMAGYRIASNHHKADWKDKLAEVPERLREYAADYLRWAWKRDPKDDFEVHP